MFTFDTTRLTLRLRDSFAVEPKTGGGYTEMAIGVNSADAATMQDGWVAALPTAGIGMVMEFGEICAGGGLGCTCASDPCFLGNHEYEIVYGSYTYAAAEAMAASMSKPGKPGYLATITSMEEKFETFKTRLRDYGCIHIFPNIASTSADCHQLSLKMTPVHFGYSGLVLNGILLLAALLGPQEDWMSEQTSLCLGIAAPTQTPTTILVGGHTLILIQPVQDTESQLLVTG